MALPLAVLAGGLALWFLPNDRGLPDPGSNSISSAVTKPAAPGTPSAPASTAADPGVLLRQEREISELIRANRSVASKAAELLRLLPTLQPELQDVAAQHLTHLADSAQWREAVQLMADARIADSAREILIGGIYNRDPMEACGLFILLLEKGPESMLDEAERTLAVLLQADHGRDAEAWKKEWASARARLSP